MRIYTDILHRGHLVRSTAKTHSIFWVSETFGPFLIEMEVGFSNLFLYLNLYYSNPDIFAVKVLTNRKITVLINSSIN